MTYIALLRGINVGGNRKVEMKKLKALFESLGYADVSTYINSGNVLFDSEQPPEKLRQSIEENLNVTFGFEVPTLVISTVEMKKVVEEIPDDWVNDKTQKSDVAFLFPEIDSEETIELMPVKREYMTILYRKGYISWNIKRDVLNKSQLSKLAGHKIYALMTVRNINTVRRLADF